MITNQLKTASLKSTFQREKILEYIISKKEHPTAEMIYDHIVKIISNISRTTVYNNVKALTKANIIKPIKFIGENQVRYDGETKLHYHFICEKCGKIYDIYTDYDKVLNKKNIEGNKIKNVYAYFSGICKNCK
jgi:Fe2+ or Zn2+ uptake regulation protein